MYDSEANNYSQCPVTIKAAQSVFEASAAVFGEDAKAIAEGVSPVKSKKALKTAARLRTLNDEPEQKPVPYPLQNGLLKVDRLDRDLFSTKRTFMHVRPSVVCSCG